MHRQQTAAIHYITCTDNWLAGLNKNIIQFNCYNMYVSVNQCMNAVSAQTKQWVADLKMNGSVRDVAFTPDGAHMLSVGSESYIVIM